MAAEHVHSPTPEEVMEYLDGEGTPAARAGIEAHLAACPACQAVAAGQRGQARVLAAWQVDPAPDSLRAPEAAQAKILRPWWRPTRLVLAGLSTAALALVFLSYQTRRAPRSIEAAAQMAYARGVNKTASASADGVIAVDGRSARIQSAPMEALASKAPEEANQVQVPHGPAVIRTATLQLVAKDFNHARSAVDVILDSTGGFADQLGLSADPGSARVLRGTVRVPGTRLTDALTRLRALGEVTQDQQSAQDVADQLVDLDARLKSARATEQRLIDLLKNRTGKLSDVLEVEQELTRVRLDIERLDAEKTNMTRRVAYATIDLTISEARKVGLDPGPLPLLTQLRVATADGLQTVVDTIVGISLFALRAGPSLVLWGVVGLALWIAGKRVLRMRTGSPA